MSNKYTITPTKKFQRLSLIHYEYIINQYVQHIAYNQNKRRNIGTTALIEKLALDVGASKSTIYDIIKESKIICLTYDLKEVQEYSALAAYNKRNKKGKCSNALKLHKAKPFIDLVISEMKSNQLSSVDETINYLKLHLPQLIEGMETVCTKTFYNYIHKLVLEIKPMDLPRTVQRKSSSNDKTYIAKNQKGTSIDERPFPMECRDEFGHWEGDLIVGSKEGKSGALLTLLERKTRFYYVIPISCKSAKQVFMKINQLNKLYGDYFSDIFKSITFDNGSEFARYRDIEKKPGTKNYRTRVYFAHPYRSCERGSNENCNQLVRYFIKKGTDINLFSKDFLLDMNIKINEKKRKIHNYESSTSKFLKELSAILDLNTQSIYL